MVAVMTFCAFPNIWLNRCLTANDMVRTIIMNRLFNACLIMTQRSLDNNTSRKFGTIITSISLIRSNKETLSAPCALVINILKYPSWRSCSSV
jgi:hypothetical protein